MRTVSVFCRECDHEHECPVVQDEFDDWVDAPDTCESCGVELDDSGPSESECRAAERQQMGIC
jgi:hypothetical protein